MAIIAELETQRRGLYTGTIGFISPDRQAQFNVAIRTVVIDRGSGWMEYGTGGGVVWDSQPQLELAESHTKARILVEPPSPSFSLIETLRWTPAEGFFLLARHLIRLHDLAEYFGFACDLTALEVHLRALARRLPLRPMRIRVLVERNGTLSLESDALEPEDGRVRRGALATTPVRREDPFLYHKTTFRRVYETARAVAPGVDDVILFNGQGEITESSIANVILELDGERYTPLLDAGLLARGPNGLNCSRRGSSASGPSALKSLDRIPDSGSSTQCAGSCPPSWWAQPPGNPRNRNYYGI